MPLFGALFGFLILGQVPGRVVLASLVFAGLGAVWVIFRGDVDALLAFDLGYGEAIFCVGVACLRALLAAGTAVSNRGEVLIGFTFWTNAGDGVLDRAVRCGRDRSDRLAGAAAGGVGGDHLPRHLHHLDHLLPDAVRLDAACRHPRCWPYTYLTPTFVILIEGLLGHGWAPLSVLAGAMIPVPRSGRAGGQPRLRRSGLTEG